MVKLTVRHGYDGCYILDSFKKTEEEKTAQLNIKTQTEVYANSNQHQELYWEAKLRQIFNIPKAGTGFYTFGLLGCRWTKLYLVVITRNICHLCDILYLRSPVAKAKNANNRK